MFDLPQLNVLSAVARTGSYSAAARELRITQPAVTYQMRQLEKDVGAVLAIRVGRTMRLTSAGQQVRLHGERLLEEARAAERLIAASVGSESATVRVAAFPSSCATIVPSALARLRRSHPQIDIVLTQCEPPEAHALVRRGEVDLALAYRFADLDEVPQASVTSPGLLRRIPLVVDEVRILLPADHRCAGRGRMLVTDLAEETFILGSALFADILADLSRPLGRTPASVRVADDYVAMQAFVAYRLGVAPVPELALRAHRDRRVVARRLEGWPARHVEIELWPDQLKVGAITTVVAELQAAQQRTTGKR